MRKNFAQILQDNKIDIEVEYKKLYKLFYVDELFEDFSGSYPIYVAIGDSFDRIHFRGLCLSIEEFDEKYGFEFVESPELFDIDILVTLMEYVYNMIIGYNAGRNYMSFGNIIEYILKLAENIGYVQSRLNNLIIFTEKSPAAIAVAESELIPNEMSYKLISYNHHSMKGNLIAKKETLFQLGHILEGKRNDLIKANSKLESDLFYIFNKFDIRHNNHEKSSKGYYVKEIDEMPKRELEEWYDDTYEMCLLAFLEVEHLERKIRFDELKNKIENKEK